MSSEDGRITKEFYTKISVKDQAKEIFNLMDIESLTVDDHLQMYHTLLKLTGFNFLDENYTQSFYPYYCAYTLISVLTFLFSDCVFMVNNISDLAKFTECFTTFLLPLALLIKAGVLIYYKQNMKDLISRMRYEYREALKVEGPERQIMLNKFLEGRVLTRIFYCATVICTILFCIFPLLNYQDRKLPFPARIFFLTDDTMQNYVLNFAFQYYIMAFAINFFVGYESFCVYSILVLCAKLEILRYRIEQFGQSEKFYKFSGTETNEHKELAMMDDDYAVSYLKNCIKTHQSAFRFADEFNEIYRFDCFIELTFSGMIGCVSLYQVTEKSGAEVLPFYLYLFLCIVQIFVFCFYGNLIYHKSLDVSKALYGVPWFKMNFSLRTTYHITLTRSMKPINISAIFANLTLEVFTDVLRAMYSFYAVLNRETHK